MKKEITMPMTLSEEQKRLLDMHGFLNILNILGEELVFIKSLANGNTAFDGCLDVLRKMREALTDGSPTIITTHQMLEFQSYIEEEIANHTSDLTLPKDKETGLRFSKENIRSLFRIIHVRVRELLMQAECKERWITLPVAHVRENCIELLEAIAKNSRNQFGICYHREHQTENDYYIDLTISSQYNDTIEAPLVILQSFQDLLANARKYTSPGGDIHAQMISENGHLLLKVSDNGVGIPEDQIDKVMEFGFRGSNVLHKDTKGGGFGLTKAYHMTRQFNGRFWIESTLHSGTTITALIPTPS